MYPTAPTQRTPLGQWNCGSPLKKARSVSAGGENASPLDLFKVTQSEEKQWSDMFDAYDVAGDLPMALMQEP